MARRFKALFALVLLAVGGTACETSISLSLDLPPEDLTALAIVEASGTARVVELREGEAPVIELSDGDRAYAFVVAHAELVNLDGTPLPRDATSGADIRLDTDPRDGDKGSCGFCVLPATTAPQRVTPGDSCPLPPFARALDLLDGGKQIDAEPLDELRKSILVDWPGDCP